MNTSNPRFWLIGGILASLLLLAGGWTALLSPRFEKVAATRDQAVQLQDQAELIMAQALQLQRQAEDLPAQIRALQRIQTRIPSSVDVPTLLRDIERLAEENDVVIDSLSPGQITVFNAEEQRAQPATDSAEAEGTPADTPAPAPVPAPTALGQGSLPQGVGLSYVPVTITATGEFADITRFTRRIESLQRAYLITGVQLSRNASGEGEKRSNPLALTLDTRIFVSDDKLRNLPQEALDKVRGQ
jgi:Tfp pilus assembly protein PilO